MIMSRYVCLSLFLSPFQRKVPGQMVLDWVASTLGILEREYFGLLYLSDKAHMVRHCAFCVNSDISPHPPGSQPVKVDDPLPCLYLEWRNTFFSFSINVCSIWSMKHKVLTPKELFSNVEDKLLCNKQFDMHTSNRQIPNSRKCYGRKFCKFV